MDKYNRYDEVMDYREQSNYIAYIEEFPAKD